MTANLHDRHSATQLAFQWQLSDKGLLHNLNLLTECSHLWPHFAYGILAVERHAKILILLYCLILQRLATCVYYIVDFFFETFEVVFLSSFDVFQIRRYMYIHLTKESIT